LCTVPIRGGWCIDVQAVRSRMRNPKDLLDPNKRRLTPVPEDASLRYRCNVVLIGPGSHEACSRVMEAEQHNEVASMMGSLKSWPFIDPEKINKRGLVAPPSPSGRSNGREALGTLCLAEEGSPDVLRVVFNLVGGFSEPMPKLADENAVRNTCFVYMCDSEEHPAKDIVSAFESAATEMKFNYTKALKTSRHGKPKLRSILLIHQKGANGSREEGGEQPTLPDDAIVDFATKLAEIVKGSPVEGVRKADLRSPDSLYAFVEDTAREMFKASSRRDKRDSLMSSFSRGTLMAPRNSSCTVS